MLPYPLSGRRDRNWRHQWGWRCVFGCVYTHCVRVIYHFPTMSKALSNLSQFARIKINMGSNTCCLVQYEKLILATEECHKNRNVKRCDSLSNLKLCMFTSCQNRLLKPSQCTSSLKDFQLILYFLLSSVLFNKTILSRCLTLYILSSQHSTQFAVIWHSTHFCRVFIKSEIKHLCVFPSTYTTFMYNLILIHIKYIFIQMYERTYRL